MGQTLLLSEQDVHDLLSMEDVVAAVEKTFQGMGEGTVINPSKVNLDLGESAPYPPYNGFMNAMPAYVGFADVAGLKSVSYTHLPRGVGADQIGNGDLVQIVVDDLVQPLPHG